jgi:hypothetical protein
VMLGTFRSQVMQEAILGQIYTMVNLAPGWPRSLCEIPVAARL